MTNSHIITNNLSLLLLLSKLRDAYAGWVQDGARAVGNIIEGAREKIEDIVGPAAVNIVKVATANMQFILAKVFDSPVTGAPIFGPYCGPDDLKPVAWVIPDAYRYGTSIVSFKDACIHHDHCYTQSGTTKPECDRIFREEIQKECGDKLEGPAMVLVRSDCMDLTQAYFLMVSSLGSLGYEAKKEWAGALTTGVQKCMLPRQFVDVSGDGKMDYCRAVGDDKKPIITCAVSRTDGSGFNDHAGYDIDNPGDATLRQFVDVNGDGKVDYCRAVDVFPNTSILCGISTGTWFDDKVGYRINDIGYPVLRQFIDVNGDGKVDYCRAVGDGANPHMSCAISRADGRGFEASGYEIRDLGYPVLRQFVDVNGDGKVDYCRAVGDGANPHMSCAISKSDNTGFEEHSGYEIRDLGYPTLRQFVDVNGDGKVDYCRAVGDGASPHMSCAISTGTAFEERSYELRDLGYPALRQFVDVIGDGKMDYCRAVGDWQNPHLKCAASRSDGTGFDEHPAYELKDIGDPSLRQFADVNGDGKMDYCRMTGIFPNAIISCAISTGAGFKEDGYEIKDPGYLILRKFVDVNGDGKMDYCRAVGDWQNPHMSCAISTESGFEERGYELRDLGYEFENSCIAALHV